MYERIGSSREYVFIQTKSFGCQPTLKKPQPHQSKPYVRSCLASFPSSSPAPVYSLGFSLFSTPACQQPFSSSHIHQLQSCSSVAAACANSWLVGCYMLPFAPTRRLPLPPPPPPPLGMRRIRGCNDMLS